MLKATQILFDTVRPVKENIKEHDNRSFDGDNFIFADNFKSTLDKATAKDSKTSKSVEYKDNKSTKENDLIDEDKKAYERAISKCNLVNLQASIHPPMDLEINNTVILNETASIENLNIDDIDITINSLDSIKKIEAQLLDSVHGNEISHDSQGLTINISNLDQVETQPDIQYIESHNKQISIEKTMEQKTHLGFLENSNSEQLIINEKKIELDYLTKPEEQLELKSQQLDERNITIDIHNTQEYDMQDINNNEDQEYIEDLIDYEGETFTQELGTEQEEINQKTYDDGLDDNIQLRIDNLNVIGSTSQQDSTLDFTKVLLSHDLTERVKIIEQLADKAVMTFNEGNTELEIQIKPEHLGKLVLKVGLDDGVLTGKIYTVTQEIKEFLQENLDVLRNSLRDQGLVFASLDVDVGSQSSSYNFKYLPSSQSSSRKASKFTNFITIETDEGKSTLLGSLSKIDYLA